MPIENDSARAAIPVSKTSHYSTRGGEKKTVAGFQQTFVVRSSWSIRDSTIDPRSHSSRQQTALNLRQQKQLALHIEGVDRRGQILEQASDGLNVLCTVIVLCPVIYRVSGS